MYVCIPTVGEGGLQARLSPHFGSAPCFTLVDTVSGRVEIVWNEHSRHEPGKCSPAKGLAGRGIDAIICRGLGRRALAGLTGSGLSVLLTEAWTVEEALGALDGGALRPITDEEACAGGHGHGHGHAHDH